MTQVGQHFEAGSPGGSRQVGLRADDAPGDRNAAYIASDASGLIVAWNAQAEEMFGWAQEEVHGRPLVDIVAAAPSAPLVAACAARLLELGLGPAGGQRLELEAVNRHGLAFPAEATMWATPQGGLPALHALVTDISERRRNEGQLYRMARLVNALDEAVLGVSPEGLILSWNSGAARTFGYKGFEVVGKSMAVLVAPERRAEVRGWWADLDGSAPRSYETVGVRRSGVLIDLAVSVSPLRDGGEGAPGASVIARDITEQRWTADTLESTLRSLEAALQTCRESEASSRRFLADAAHQLRTPIAGIRACAETLLRGAPPDQRDHLLLDVVRETSRASRVMTGLLRMARVDQGETLTFHVCDLVGVCGEEVERSRSLAPNLAIELRAGPQPDVGPELDANVLREILANLLDNARRHAAGRVEVVVEATAETVVVRVVDDGAGLAAEAVERAFQRFISLDGQGGSGLGLPIARGLAQAHGGDLTYEHGFVLRLPSRPPRFDCGGAGRPRPTG